MKKIILLILVVASLKSFAQQANHNCATDQVMKNLFDKRPDLKDFLLQRLSNRIAANNNSSASYTIPIVFHILHLGGPENIDDSQVIDAVNILNRDFARQNSDTADIIPSMKPIADSTGIQFALATIDPNGNCTNGIVHYFDADADWTDTSPTLYSYTWDPTMYLNVYVVRSITLSSGFGAAGYTYFPGSFPPGDPWDAVVVLNNYLGSVGTGSILQSRVLTHEVGHWLNLLHVFGFNGAGVDCSGDDYINDTPTTPGYLLCPDVNNPASYQICSPGVDENFQNFMDYSYCCKMFTQEQGQSMRTALNDNISGRDNLWSASNLLATGVTNPGNPCIPIADFTYNRSVTCTGTPVTFFDASWNGQPTTYNWSFPSGNPSSSTSPNPIVTYSTTGTYSATLTTSNTSGTSAPVTKTNIITVINNTAAYQSAWAEGFEGTALPNTDWSIANSSGGVNWVQSFDASYSGVFSAKLPSTGNTRKAVTSMTSPSINLSSVTNPAMTFKVATTEINPAHINKLEVLISTDCEQTWSILYSKSGSTLITTIDSVTPFIPTMQSQWRSEFIALNAFAVATSAKFKFVYTRDTLPSPSNVFIDDINVQSFSSIAETSYSTHVEIYPNPSDGILNIDVTAFKNSSIHITLFDMPGKVVEHLSNGSVSRGDHHFAMGTSQKLQSGLYLLKIKADDKVMVRQVVIK